jgi:hypothetical protein
VAKKRKGARPTKKASRSVKKKAARKAAPRKVAAKQVVTGLEDPGKVDFNPLKEQLAKHIARLQSAKVPTERIANAVRILTVARDGLTVECLPTMELQTS